MCSRTQRPSERVYIQQGEEGQPREKERYTKREYIKEVWRWDVGTHLKDIQSHRQRLQGLQHVHGHLFILGTRATRERNAKGGSKDREESVD